MEIFDCEQGSEDWFRCRMGIPTASQFSTVMSKGQGRGGPRKGRTTYMYKLAGERITGQPMDNFSNSFMEAGKGFEPEARALYSFMRTVQPVAVGFIKNENRGCSPDSLVGDDGMLEIKTKLPHLLIEILLRNEFPTAHKAQCQGSLWVAEREWIDLVCYCPGMPPFIKRAYRDPEYIEKIADEVGQFNEELDRTIQRVRRYAGGTDA